MTQVQRPRRAIGRARLGDMAGLLEYGSLRPADWDEADEMLAQSLRSARQPEMIAPDNVGFRERLTSFLGEQLGGGRAAQRRADKLMQISEAVASPLGAANDASAARVNFNKGNYLEGGIDSVAAALGLIPGFSAMTRSVKGPAKQAIRGILNTDDLRKMTQDEAIKSARLEPHLIQDASGQYVGAPRGVKSSEDIANMRANFDADVAAGASGANWYQRARDFNEVIPGSDPYRQNLAASEQALFSAQANPDTNLGFALQAHNAYEAGVPMDKVRTGAQAKNYNTSRDASPTGLPSLGKKTGVYGQHLDPQQVPATTGTNDIWHARGFGYTNSDGTLFSRALTPQEHRFLDYETMLAVDRANKAKLGGKTDWTAAETQAAPWVAGKGRAEAARRNLSEEEGIAIASMTYPDFAPKYTAFSTSEQVPGKSTGILADVQASNYAAKEAFTNRAPWLDDLGRDPIYSDLNMYVRPSDQGPGYYINSQGIAESNPVAVGKPMISYRVDEATDLVNVSDVDRAALDAGEAVRGLLDAQEGAAWNKVITSATKGPDRSSFDINVGRMLSREELEQVNSIADKYGYGMANTENGVALLDFGGRSTAEAGKLLKGDMGKELENVLPNADIKRGRLASGYIDQSENLSSEFAGEGKATQQLVSVLNDLQEKAPGYYDKLLDSAGVAKKARANLERLYEYGGKGQRVDYEELLKIVGKDKLRGLINRIASSGYRGLPAIGGVAIGGGLLAGGDDNAQDLSDLRL